MSLEYIDKTSLKSESTELEYVDSRKYVRARVQIVAKYVCARIDGKRTFALELTAKVRIA